MAKTTKPAGKKRGAGTKGDTNDSYSVGFGKPPLETRFKPGQSGNPNGRKKGSVNFASEVRRVFGRKLTVQIHGSNQRMTMSEAVLSKIVTKGLNGDTGALRLSVNLMQAADADEPVSATLFESAGDRQLLQEMFSQVGRQDGLADKGETGND